jgi:enoyl-CoA hydratase
MTDPAVLFGKEDAVGVITLNRPERLNAINHDLLHDFATHLRTATDDNGIQAVVLTGAGRAFCAGDDLKEVAEGKSDDYWRQEISDIQDIQRLMTGLGKPLIAAIRGYAVGGGCEFAVGCDIRIASDNAKFGFPEVGLGFLVGSATTKLLPQIVGLGRAKELLFTAEFIDADEAYRIGLANKIVADDDLMNEAMALAKSIADKSPLSLRLTREALDKAPDLTVDEVLDLEEASFLQTIELQGFDDRVGSRLDKMGSSEQ